MGSTAAKSIDLLNALGLFAATNVEDALNELAASVRGGRQLESGGESIFDPQIMNTGVAATTQQLRLGGFTARSTKVCTQIKVVTSTTAAGPTPTKCRFGVYERDRVTDVYTQVAATPDDTTLFAATTTTYPKNFSAPFQKKAGFDYLVGMLIVSAAAFPTFVAPNAIVNTAYATDFLLPAPIRGGVIAAQADLPASFAAATVTVAGPNFHALLL